MKRRITKAEYDALPDAVKAFYTVDGDNFKLMLTDDDDPDALRRARDREKQEAKDAKKRVAELEAELDTLKTGDARKTGDIKLIEESWKTKLSASESQRDTRIKALIGNIEKMLVEGETTKIASAITKPENAFILTPHIQGRISIEWNGDEPTVRVKDRQGKPSAMSTEDLQKEFASDSRFSTLILGSKGSGAGGPDKKTASNGGAGGTGTKTFADMTEPERVQLHRDDPTEFKRQADEYKASLLVR
jgi:hypothetical protein